MAVTLSGIWSGRGRGYSQADAAIRSLAYNRELQPLVEDKIERAEASIRGYLLVNGVATARVGPYQVDMDEEGDISLTRLPVDDWQQMPLSQLGGS